MEKYSSQTLLKSEYYATDRNLKINPYDLNDYGLVRTLIKEIIFRGIEVEYQDLSPQMNYVLDACIRESTSIPTLIDNVVNYEEQNLPFRLNNLDKTKAALLVRLEPYRSNPALSEIFYTEASTLNLEKLDDVNILIDLHPRREYNGDIVDESTPELYATERIPFEKKIIYQRYQIKELGFYWLIAELDPKTNLAFGYANLNNDTFAEWGYISIRELLENGAELDREWKSCAYSEARERLAKERAKP